MSYHKDAKGLGEIETVRNKGNCSLKRDKSYAYLDIYMLEKQKEIYQNIEKSMEKRKTVLARKLSAIDIRIDKMMNLQQQEPYLENKEVEDPSSSKNKEACLEKKWKRVTLQY